MSDSRTVKCLGTRIGLRKICKPFDWEACNKVKWSCKSVSWLWTRILCACLPYHNAFSMHKRWWRGIGTKKEKKSNVGRGRNCRWSGGTEWTLKLRKVYGRIHSFTATLFKEVFYALKEYRLYGRTILEKGQGQTTSCSVFLFDDDSKHLINNFQNKYWQLIAISIVRMDCYYRFKTLSLHSKSGALTIWGFETLIQNQCHLQRMVIAWPAWQVWVSLVTQMDGKPAFIMRAHWVEEGAWR